MDANQKQKLNKIINLKWFLLSAIVCLYANCAFAAPQENLSDEFFAAAMQVESPEKYNGINADAINLVKTAGSSSTEQAMAAEQVGEETMLAGNNLLHNIKSVIQQSNDGLKDFGSSIGGNIGSFTGENPFITKLLVVFILVAISILIIVVLVLFAKKFVFKKKNLSPFDTDEDYDEEFDESNFDEDEEIEDIDGEEDFDEEPQIEEKQRVSHTRIPPKSQIEHTEVKSNIEKTPILQEEINSNIAEQSAPTQNSIPNSSQTQTVEMINRKTRTNRLEVPQDVKSAMKIFLKITAE